MQEVRCLGIVPKERAQVRKWVWKPEMSAPGKVIVEALTVTNHPIKTLMIYYAPVILLDSKMSLHL